MNEHLTAQLEALKHLRELGAQQVTFRGGRLAEVTFYPPEAPELKVNTDDPLMEEVVADINRKRNLEHSRLMYHSSP